MTHEISKAENLKLQSNGLRSTIADELHCSKSRFSNDADQILKFHGIYQQKDRDRRKAHEKSLGPKPFTLMVRGRIPGGRLTPEQWQVWDDLAYRYSSNGLRLTTRQSIQIHGVLKSNIQETIKDINESLQTTTGSCGDVVRNVTQAVNPWGDPKIIQLDEVADRISKHFEIQSRGYFDIFLGGKNQTGNDKETIYGPRFLPRKFKIGVTIEGNNHIDVYSHDLAFVASFNLVNELEGYHVFVGGGMGMSHKDPQTRPRLADQLGWIEADQLIQVAEAVVTIQRDLGNRLDRSQSRLKYTVAKYGIEKFKQILEEKSQLIFQKRALPPWKTPSLLGWHTQGNGLKALGIHLLSGRIVDTEKKKLKTALKTIIARYASRVQITAEQDLILEGIKNENVPVIESLLDSFGISPFTHQKIFDRAVTCVALPTCVKALAESERVGEDVISSIHSLLSTLQISRCVPTVRITGCPNGCARPYLAEIALVGQSPGKYAVFLGGCPEGTRLAKKSHDSLSLIQIYDFLLHSFSVWAQEAVTGEYFGNFVNRVGIDHLKLEYPGDDNGKRRESGETQCSI